MLSKQEAKLNMYRSVQKFCNDNQALIESNAAFKLCFKSYSILINNIISTATGESLTLSGIAMDKTVAKKALTQNAADVAGIIFAYASSIKNNTLKQEVKYAYSDFFRIKDDLLVPTAQNIVNAATANLDALAPFGVTQEVLDGLIASMQQYSIAVPHPKTAKSIKSTYTQNLKDLFKEADSILKEQMDKLVINFKAANPDFITTYKKARVIIDAATSSTQIKGTVTDAATAQPLPDATVTLTGPDASVKVTLKSGAFSFKPLAPGTYNLLVSRSGYADLYIREITVKLGQALRQAVALKAA